MSAASVLGRVAEVVTDAARATAGAAGEYVAEPVGKALGLIGPEAPAERPTKSARKASRKAAVARAEGAAAAKKVAARKLRR
jgi:hypothetical protein